MDFEVKSETALAADPAVQSKQGLLYVMPQSLSASVNATFIRQQSQRQTYDAGSTIVFDINSGSRFVDPDNCALVFDIVTDNGDNDTVYRAFSSNAGATAIIDEIRIHAKSGVELDRIEHCNQYVFSKSLMKEDSDYFNKYGSLWGMCDPKTTAANIPDHSKLGTNKRRYIIPMKVISCLFNPIVKGMKLPPGLISGSRIEIVLAQPGRVFGEAVGGPAATTYTITDPYIEMMSHELSDNSQRVLNEEAVSSGLEFAYTRVFGVRETSGASTVNFQIKKAVAQGLRAFCMPILATDDSTEGKNSFTGNLEYQKYQYRVGSMYFPQQKVEGREEGFYVSQSMYNKHRTSGWYSNVLSMDTYKELQPIMGAGLERDATLNLAGIPINNSNTLTLEATTAAATNYNYYLFLEYVAVARSFISNVEVKF